MSDPQDERVRASILVTGRVQGVFYRASAMEQAQRLGLTGWVMNLPDGRVESVVEGSRAAVEEYLAWCRRGPPAAHVAAVDVHWGPATGEFETFRIRR
ncbi:MAG: acylphosphatase [Deltaproteobacteria bacterium]|nr:MAG: acylphosphatase [Deltaproteobacteria bacterium]